MIKVLKDNRGISAVLVLEILSGIAILLFLLPFLWQIFDFKSLAFSDGILDGINKVSYLFYLTGYFIPIGFICNCLFVVLILKYSHVFFSLINYFIGLIRGK